MYSTENVTPKAIAKFIPEIYKGKKYVNVTKGETKTITTMARNVYQAKDENFNPMVSKIDGHPIMRKIVYVGFDDGTYSSFKTDVAVSQLESIVEDYDETEKVWDLVSLGLTQKVRIIEINQEYGKGNNKKSYPVKAFEPLDN